MEISWTDRMKREGVLHSQGGEEYPTYNKKRKANWIGHILHKNCLLKHVIEGKIEGTARQSRRHKQQLGKLKDIREHSKLKKVAPVCTVWRTGLEVAMDLL